ncbi:MAG: HDIG domain-containing protein [Desulfatiglandales bacterium]
MIPSLDMCLSLMEEVGMPEHIRRHSIMVEEAAVLIGEAHIHAGVHLSEDMIRAGALLHDIAKARCLETGEDHAAKGRDMCLELGLDEIAAIVGEHVRLEDFRPDAAILEKEIVFYADKRVNHDRIVSLEERLEDLILRYGKGRKGLIERIERNFAVCRDVERKLFYGLEFGPEAVARLISPGRDAALQLETAP